MPSQRGHMPPRSVKEAFSVFVLPSPRSTVTAPLAFTDGTLNEYAWGEPMCGSPSLLKRIRSMALASVAVPTVDRGLAPHPLLVDDDRRGQAVEQVHVGPCQRRHEALYEGAVGLVDQALRFGGDRVENERALPRSGDSGEHRQAALGDLDGDVLEVVLAGAIHPDQIVAVGHMGRRRMPRRSSRAELRSGLLPQPDGVSVVVGQLRHE